MQKLIFQTKAVSGHIPRCRSREKYVCALCSSAFSSQAELKAHKSEVHFTCEVCGRDFIDAGDFFERHQLKCKKMKEFRAAQMVVQVGSAAGGGGGGGGVVASGEKKKDETFKVVVN